MLFNSFTFLLIFLPVTLLIYYKIVAYARRETAILWLVVASLFFYGWWNLAYVLLIVSSILFNYLTGSLLARYKARWILWIGISANLLLLIYFKYTAFIIANIMTLTGTHLEINGIILPLAISFLTFQQIAYLADVYSGDTVEFSFHHYALFVLFFPQLIAGPIVHHREMLPQFTQGNLKFRHHNLAAGFTIFTIGLFKKVIIADNLSGFSDTIFAAAEIGNHLTLIESWTGALAYSFQLYFDFSGYSDMAIGLARMFGIRIPINFNAPYKASNIIDFWRRWHITLSRFLRDYLYIPLGGNRKGKLRRYINLIVTMLLGGLWHGASWSFFIWGGLHAVYLIINHGYRYIFRAFSLSPHAGTGKLLSTSLTFLAVVVAWVFFRAESFSGATEVLRGMSGLNGFVLDNTSHAATIWILISMAIAWVFPTTQDFIRSPEPVADQHNQPAIVWRTSPIWSFLTALMAIIVILNLHAVSEFLYFRF